MKKHKSIFFSPEEKARQLDSVMRKVKKQVKLYRKAETAGTLRTSLEATKLFC